MRLLHVLPILTLLFGASASSFDSRTLDAHPLDARDVLDVCASLVNVELIITIVEDDDPDDDFNVDIGRLESCVCLSGVAQFVSTNPTAVFAAAYANLFESESAALQTVTNAITNLITSHAPTTCNYPDNSVPACVDGNPCGFTCTDGLTAYPLVNPTMCGCPAPNVVCNGNCVAPGACPSITVAYNQRRWVGSGSCTEKGHGWAACGVFGGASRAWECVDTAHDLESCGGCVLPLTPFSPIGKDCTALPGVADVSCLSGECVVRRCMPGHTLSREGTHCVSTQTHSRPHVSAPEGDEEYLQAIRYGLEHRPL